MIVLVILIYIPMFLMRFFLIYAVIWGHRFRATVEWHTAQFWNYLSLRWGSLINIPWLKQHVMCNLCNLTVCIKNILCYIAQDNRTEEHGKPWSAPNANGVEYGVLIKIKIIKTDECKIHCANILESLFGGKELAFSNCSKFMNAFCGELNPSKIKERQ